MEEETEDKSELLLKTFYQLVSAIFGQNPNSGAELRRIMSDDISGFGTGKHEIFNSYEEYIENIYRVFGKQLPTNAKLHFLDVRYTLRDAIGIVHGTYDINYILNGVESKYYGRRSTVFEWQNDCWRAIHLHVSEASAHLTEGESFPVEALKAQNEELRKLVSLKTEELSGSLKNLQETQQQLIQAAKMASLGELTAGIAHEIQNPLNFVNNFSEVNKELIVELKDELHAGNNAEVVSLASAVDENLEKILHHGKRADSIVKAMLQHSRSNTGKRELTDINALAEEYLRLSYHGLRAKDKSFNATFTTDFDQSLEKIKIVPEDIGRVLLNLYNNAFYAVHAKKISTGSNYEPSVSVSTQQTDTEVIIKVKDNGNGIPVTIVDKIFQPFFTTKPTGEGTGLGLSLSYDIIKAHGGVLKVDTKEGEGASFIIQLPG